MVDFTRRRLDLDVVITWSRPHRDDLSLDAEIRQLASGFELCARFFIEAYDVWRAFGRSNDGIE